MHYLNSTDIFDAKILRVFNGNSILYAVVIGVGVAPKLGGFVLMGQFLKAER